MICPACGNWINAKTYYDETGLVERDYKCACGYHYNWAYGQETEEWRTFNISGKIISGLGAINATEDGD